MNDETKLLNKRAEKKNSTFVLIFLHSELCYVSLTIIGNSNRISQLNQSMIDNHSVIVVTYFIKLQQSTCVLSAQIERKNNNNNMSNTFFTHIPMPKIKERLIMLCFSMKSIDRSIEREKSELLLMDEITLHINSR